MFGKSQAKQSSHSSIDHIISHYIPQSVSEFVVKYPKTSYFFVIFQCRNSSLTKTTDSCSFLLKKYFIVVNLRNITLSLNHSILYVCCWRRNQRARDKSSMKTSFLLLTKSPNARSFCFSLYFSFVFFVFVSWPIETTTANLQCLTRSNPSKSTNQVTLSNGHMNYLFWA